MKKLSVFIGIFCMFFIQKTYAQGVVFPETLEVRNFSDGNQYLTYSNGQLFTGTRGTALDLEKNIVRQPREKNLMILNEDIPTNSLFVFKSGKWLLLKSGLEGDVYVDFSPEKPFEIVITEVFFTGGGPFSPHAEKITKTTRVQLQ